MFYYLLFSGLLRRNDDANRFPLGVLPLGRTNTLGNSLFPGGDGVERVKQLIEASMAIIKGDTMWKDALKIEQIGEPQEETPRPIYALCSVQWGAFRDTMARKDKYWFTGGLREYATFIFNGYKNSITWDCNGTIKYTPPCTGCSNCLQKRQEVKRTWSFFMPSTQAAAYDQALTINPECSKTEELCFKTSEFRIETSTKKQEVPSLNIVLGRNGYSYTQFISDGWNRLKNRALPEFTISARTVEIQPEDPGREVTIEIDKEEFELKPVKITVLPKVVKFFCKPSLNNT